MCHHKCQKEEQTKAFVDKKEVLLFFQQDWVTFWYVPLDNQNELRGPVVDKIQHFHKQREVKKAAF